jgi:4-hydroxy-tetrahydrodipicolinate reductase
MIKLAISGACGRMAGQVLQRAVEDKELKVVAAIDVKNIGKDVGEVLGIGAIGVKVVDVSKLEEELQKTKPDLLVDFTNPGACVGNVNVATANKIGVVVGTTGLSDDQSKELKEAIEKNKVVGIIAPNFSVCVNLFFKIAAEAAKTLKDYDIEIIEAHHRFKKDAPSGTAKKLAQAMADSLNRDLSKVAVYGRRGMVGERNQKEIGIHSVRAGDIIGDHTVIFGNIGERMEIKHQAHSRDSFALGCIQAIKWLGEQKPGVYDMWDVLELK